MIIQLPNGRIIECSVEQYLSFSDQEVQDLNGLSAAYTKEVGDPFYNKYSNRSSKVEPDLSDYIEENEPALDEIDAYEKLDDSYFHPDDV
jgi:hypothetical protein